MFVRIVDHWAEKGWENKDKDSMEKSSSTLTVKESPESIAAYKLVSRNDPTKFTTITIWKSKEAWQKWHDARQHLLKTQTRTRMWGRIDDNDYDSF